MLSEAAAASTANEIEAALGGNWFDAVRQAVAAFDDAPKTPQQWFDFLRSYGDAERRLLRRLKAVAPGAPVEAFASLNAALVSLDHADAAGLPRSVRRRFDDMCREWAAMDTYWVDHFDVDNPRFYDVAELATLHRVLAGEAAFAFGERLPFDFFLRCHPLHLPNFVVQMIWSMRRAAPILTLHFHYARRNRLVVSQLEFERALWRMAKTLEMNPRYAGISTNSWFHSVAVREAFPRLAWMRDVFLDGGAYAIDFEAGHAEDIGYNSAKRKELNEQGKFLPRHTLVLWPRDAVLTWAASRPDLKDPNDREIIAPHGRLRLSIGSPKPRPNTRWNSPLHLWDSVRWRRRFGAKYWAAVLLGPGLLAAAVFGALTGWAWGLLALCAGVLTAYVVQYYVSQ